MGKSVFIWGGSDSSGAVLDSGAIYSTMTDTWTAVAKDTYTPTARVFATAVWTGSVVVVFGGSDASGATPYKDGAVYDPAQDTWSAIPTAGKARSQALGFWDGTRAIYWGGVAAFGAAVSGADRFDLATWSASSATGDPGAELDPASGWDGTALYLHGGFIANVRTDKTSSYTSTTDSWANLSKSTLARSNEFGVWDGARFVVWGGIDNTALRNDGRYQSGANWALMSNMGAPSARMAVPRRHGWIFQTSPGVIALFGGETSIAGQGMFTNTGATYNVVTAKWGYPPAWPSGETHDYGVGVWTGDEFVLWGGRTGPGTTPASTLTGERWKP
jgi:Kelch motif protein